MKIAVIVSQFNSVLTDKLLVGAKRALDENKVDYEVFEVPGACEILVIAATLLEKKKVDAIVPLGVVIKGETEHYDLILQMISGGLRELMLTYRAPVMTSILFVPTQNHAEDRAGSRNDNNAGYRAANVAVEMVNLLKKL